MTETTAFNGNEYARGVKPARGNDQRIIGYKAFDPDFKCRGFQYEVGKTFEHEGKIELSSEGFHFCHKDPFDVFEYYPLVHRKHGLSPRFAKVSAPKKDTIAERENKKCVTSKISIDEEITLDDLIDEQIKKAYKSEDKAGLLVAEENAPTLTDKNSHTKIISDKMYTAVALVGRCSRALVSADGTRLASSGFSAELFATGDYANVSSSGRFAKIYSNGHYSSTSASGRDAELRIKGDETNVAASGSLSALNVEGESVSVSSSGKGSTLNVTGADASVATSGLYAKLTVKGDRVATASSSKVAELRIIGNCASVASSGALSKLTVTGGNARIAAVGMSSKVTYKGQDGVITVLGFDAKFKGSKGTLVLAVVYDWGRKPTGGLVGRIGENGLKPDTLYTVSNGKFVEAEAEDE